MAVQRDGMDAGARRLAEEQRASVGTDNTGLLVLGATNVPVRMALLWGAGAQFPALWVVDVTFPFPTHHST